MDFTFKQATKAKTWRRGTSYIIFISSLQYSVLI
jgi:hypothetical protein